MARSCSGRGELRERVDVAACAEDDGAMATCGSRPRAYLSRGVVNWANWWLMR
uniref:Uncharacterized protein n=1 Tax=Oryza barthii TaxID=65489 RepID=A0A0D3ET09_9ORYZ